LLILFLLTSCLQKKTAVEKIYTVLESVVSAEKEFVDQQDPLVSLEKKEKNTYDKIIGLGMKQSNEIDKLSDEALAMAEKRKRLIGKETKSIKESEKEFQKIEDLKNEIQDKDLKKRADELYQLMKNRYKAHDTLNQDYLSGIINDEKLYKMFKDKNLSTEELENQVVEVNNSYKKIYQSNDQFNSLTEQYNTKKLLFYKKAGLKIKN
jgi:hypothetical protein